MTVFGSEAHGLNLIARANRLVEAERWNAPQVGHLHITLGKVMLDVELHYT